MLEFVLAVFVLVNVTFLTTRIAYTTHTRLLRAKWVVAGCGGHPLRTYDTGVFCISEIARFSSVVSWKEKQRLHRESVEISRMKLLLVAVPEREQCDADKTIEPREETSEDNQISQKT